MSVMAIRRLVCACCGESTKGRQWHDRDAGYGVCASCFSETAGKQGLEEAERLYGKTGIHHSLEAVKLTPLQSFKAYAVAGAELWFHRFLWGRKPTPPVKRRVMAKRSHDVIISSERNEKGSHLQFPLARKIVEHRPGVFWILNDDEGDGRPYTAFDVMVYDFNERDLTEEQASAFDGLRNLKLVKGGSDG